MSLLEIFDEKHKACEILFHKGAVNIKDLPFFKHNGRGKVHAMMASHLTWRLKEISRRHLRTSQVLIEFLNKFRTCLNLKFL